jgi:hypothetical protein
MAGARPQRLPGGRESNEVNESDRRPIAGGNSNDAVPPASAQKSRNVDLDLSGDRVGRIPLRHGGDMHRTNRHDPAVPRASRFIWGLAAVLLPLLATTGARAAGDVVTGVPPAGVAWSTQPGGCSGWRRIPCGDRSPRPGRSDLTLLVPATSSRGRRGRAALDADSARAREPGWPPPRSAARRAGSSTGRARSRRPSVRLGALAATTS